MRHRIARWSAALFIAASTLIMPTTSVVPVSVAAAHEPPNGMDFCKHDSTHIFIEEHHLSLSHDNKDYTPHFCAVKQYVTVGGQNLGSYVTGIFTFDGGVSPTGAHAWHVVNQEYNVGTYANQPVAKWIEIAWIRIHDGNLNDDVQTKCDQTNDAGASSDGRGCNNGNTFEVYGPCEGWTSIHDGPTARADNGIDCDDVGENTDMSQTDDQRTLYLTQETWAFEVKFRVKWTDGEVGVWKELSFLLDAAQGE